MSEQRKRVSKLLGPSSLQRGKACLNCRRRKMKCDGARPACGPCVHSVFADDCEYADAHGRSRTQMLEETIVRLEERIEELENPDNAAASVLLHDPLVALRCPEPLSYGSPKSGRSSPSSSIFSQFSSGTGVTSLDDYMPELTSDLTNIFFRSVESVPWFLHERRFRESFALPPGNPARPIPALLSSVYLWAIKFSPTNDLIGHKQSLLLQALSQIGLALKDGLSHQVVQVIQAHVLLAAYLYAIGRFLEGRQQTSAAASLAMDCGLHRIRSVHVPTHYAAYVDTVEVILPEPHDWIEEGERIGAFWTAFCQDRTWAVVLGVPVIIADSGTNGTQIDTPWPMDMAVYETGRLYPTFRTAATIKTFFAGLTPPCQAQIACSLTQLSKACALFERATALAKAWRQDLPDVSAYYTTISEFEERIKKLKDQILPVTSFSQLSPAVLQRTHLVHCLVHSAVIQLHSTSVRQSASSRSKCLEAACSVLRVSVAARSQEFVYLDSVIGSIWAAACRVLINEVIFMRAAHDIDSGLLPPSDAEVIGALNQLQALMTMLAPSCALTNYQLGKLLQERAGI
ncbi:hypothetical protein K488DRAFT_89733 [Vararia minispora EC-137]|uniref:Uncharacterized protein n=1 Tax=Vararia minispora EC-137 TaxID=1314806 RepID=A0ACB8Q9N4_9AGAM|nr:hypothetical protein K488DRAFT_89733 [Vararia minispora EC-137]